MSANKDKERSNHADTVVRNHVIMSMGAGLIPILIADVFAVSALQMDMIRQLCKVYDVDFQENRGKAIVTSLSSSTLARIGARSLIKLIPGVGSIIGGVTVSVFAGASTYALGQVFKKHFEAGGTILDFDPDRLKKMYQEQFEKGKKVAETLRKEKVDVPDTYTEPLAKEDNAASTTASTSTVKEPKIPGMNADAIQKLKELGELKAQGILTEEEFAEMKKKVIEGFG